MTSLNIWKIENGYLIYIYENDVKPRYECTDETPIPSLIIYSHEYHKFENVSKVLLNKQLKCNVKKYIEFLARHFKTRKLFIIDDMDVNDADCFRSTESKEVLIYINDRKDQIKFNSLIPVPKVKLIRPIESLDEEFSDIEEEVKNVNEQYNKLIEKLMAKIESQKEYIQSLSKYADSLEKELSETRK